MCQREKKGAHKTRQYIQVQKVVKQSDVVEAYQIYDEVRESEGIEHIKRISDAFAHELGYRKNGLYKSRLPVLRTDVCWPAIYKTDKIDVTGIWNR